ncbi:hypothetical protein [Streptobacillus moniliformis]|uniref:hypothetical protein n=1 Tax=Streptobacillus moniliformis TaxID=34105 RepID=UPI0007E3EB5C|nr:hypothetical protein [Streptobacillus moniliformis]
MKKILLFILMSNFLSYSTYIAGPRIKVEGGVGIGKADNIILPLNVAILPEWRAEIRHDINVVFGPKFTVVSSHQFKELKYNGAKIRALIGAETHINFKVTNKLDIFLGAESAIGGGSDVTFESAQVSQSTQANKKKAVFDWLALMSVGLKVNERYNMGVYFGYGKGNFGIQAGYTF